MNPFNIATFLVLTAVWVITTSRSIPSCWKQLQLRFRPNRAPFVMFSVLFFQPLIWFNVYYIWGFSKNRGTPKWMVYNGKPYWNGWFGGTNILGNTHILCIIHNIYYTGMTLGPQLYGDWIPGSLISVICISWFLSSTDLALEDVASVKRGCATLGGEETSYV